MQVRRFFASGGKWRPLIEKSGGGALLSKYAPTHSPRRLSTHSPLQAGLCVCGPLTLHHTPLSRPRLGWRVRLSNASQEPMEVLRLPGGIMAASEGKPESFVAVAMAVAATGFCAVNLGVAGRYSSGFDLWQEAMVECGALRQAMVPVEGADSSEVHSKCNPNPHPNPHPHPHPLTLTLCNPNPHPHPHPHPLTLTLCNPHPHPLPLPLTLTLSPPP